jgi:hypothetical protein
MSVTSREQFAGGEGGAAKFTDYGSQFAEAQSRKETIPKAKYDGLASQIANSRRDFRDEGMGSTKIDEKLREFYAGQNLDPQLDRFAGFLIKASYRAAAQRWLRTNPHAPAGSMDEQRISKLTYEACEYNHLLREVALDGRASFDETALAGYLADVTGSDEFASSLVRGSAREIALFEALRRTPGMEDVQFADVPTDLGGIDITGSYKGELVGFDAKSDPNISQAGQGYIGRDLVRVFTVGVPADAAAKLKLTEWGEKNFVPKLDDMLAAKN